MVTMSVDLRTFRRSLDEIGRKQMPFATALALNDTAEDVEEAWELELEEKLDRPTPFTKRGIYKRRATKSRLTAEVGFKTIQAGYLKYQMQGGVRRPKGRALLVPAKTRLNKYGNMPKGSVARTIRKPGHFVASSRDSRTKHLKPGVYKRGKTSRRRASASPPRS